MKNEDAFFIGIVTMCLGMILGYHWSPDYTEMTSNGNNFFLIIGFIVIVRIAFFIIDKYYERKDNISKEKE